MSREELLAKAKRKQLLEQARAKEATATEGAQKEISPLESGLRGAGQGLTFGFSDEAIAGLRRLGGGDYAELLKEEQLKNKLAKEANPLTYSGSELGGGIATTFIPGLGLARGASVAKNIGMTGLQGLASGVGHAEGGMEDRAKAGATGFGVSSLLGAGGALIQKGMANVAPRLAETATGATGKELTQKFKPGSGEELLKRKTVGWFSSPKTIANAAEKELEASSSGIGEALSKMKAPSKDEVIQKLLQKKAGLDDVAEKSAIREIDDLVATVAKSKNPEIAQGFWNTKKIFDKNVNWADPGKSKADLLASQAYRETVEGLAEPGSELAKKFADDRRIFSTFAPIKEAAARKAATIQQRDIGGLLDTIALSGGIGSDLFGGNTQGKGTMTGIGLAGLRRGIVPRIPSFLARTTYSPTLQNAVLRLPVSTYKGLLQGDE